MLLVLGKIHGPKLNIYIYIYILYTYYYIYIYLYIVRVSCSRPPSLHMVWRLVPHPPHPPTPHRPPNAGACIHIYVYIYIYVNNPVTLRSNTFKHPKQIPKMCFESLTTTTVSGPVLLKGSKGHHARIRSFGSRLGGFWKRANHEFWLGKQW